MLRRLQLALWSAVLICITWAWIPYLAWLAPVPFLFALRGASARQALYVGFAVGALQALVLSGILFAGVALYAALVITYGLASACFAVVFATLAGPRRGVPMTLLAASAWVLVEWMHASLPFTASNILGDSQHTGPFLPLARIGGTFLVSFVLVWIAASMVALFEASIALQRRALPLVTCAGVTGALLLWAHAERPAAGPPLSTAIIQGGLPTWLYARAESAGPWRNVPQQVYTGLTRRAPPAELTVWPETAIWRYWGADPEYETLLRRLNRERGGALLVGTARQDDELSFANTGVLLTAGRPPAFADKRRLALLAEIGFSPGHGPGLVELSPGGPRLGVIFCLETVTPHPIEDVVGAGAEVVVVLADGSRFGETPVARIHADHSVIRAVEVGRDVIHAGQHGLSTFITAAGMRTPPLPAYTAAVASHTVTLRNQTTPHMRLGPWILSLGAVIILLGLGQRIREHLRPPGTFSLSAPSSRSPDQ